MCVRALLLALTRSDPSTILTRSTPSSVTVKWYMVLAVTFFSGVRTPASSSMRSTTPALRSALYGNDPDTPTMSSDPCSSCFVRSISPARAWRCVGVCVRARACP